MDWKRSLQARKTHLANAIAQMAVWWHPSESAHHRSPIWSTISSQPGPNALHRRSPVDVPYQTRSRAGRHLLGRRAGVYDCVRRKVTAPSLIIRNRAGGVGGRGGAFAVMKTNRGMLASVLVGSANTFRHGPQADPSGISTIEDTAAGRRLSGAY